MEMETVDIGQPECLKRFNQNEQEDVNILIVFSLVFFRHSGCWQLHTALLLVTGINIANNVHGGPLITEFADTMYRWTLVMLHFSFKKTLNASIYFITFSIVFKLL